MEAAPKLPSEVHFSDYTGDCGWDELFVAAEIRRRQTAPPRSEEEPASIKCLVTVFAATVVPPNGVILQRISWMVKAVEEIFSENTAGDPARPMIYSRWK